MHRFSYALVLVLAANVGCDKISEVANSVKEEANKAVAEATAEKPAADPNATEVSPAATSGNETPAKPLLPNLPSLTPRDPLAALEKLLKPANPELTDAVIEEAGEADETQRRRVQSLELISGKVTPNGMRGLQKFPELKSLAIVSGTVPPELIAPIKELTALESLAIPTSGATDAVVGALAHEQLKSLDLTNGQVSNQGLAVVDRLPALTRLVLDFCPLDGATFAEHPRLLELEAFSAQSTSVLQNGLPTILKMSKLQALNLRNAKVNDSTFPGTKTIWPALTTLHLSNNTDLSDRGTTFLKNHKQLEDVDLSISHIGNPTLGNLRFAKDLKRLRIKDTKADDKGITALQKIIKGLEVITD